MQKEHLWKGAISKILQALKLIWKVGSFCLLGTLWKLNCAFVNLYERFCCALSNPRFHEKRPQRLDWVCNHIIIKFQVLPWPLSIHMALRKHHSGTTVFLTVFPYKTTLCVSGANLKGVDMEGSQMTGINLRVATLKNAKLKNCNLRGATLAGTDLEVSYDSF